MIPLPGQYLSHSKNPAYPQILRIDVNPQYSSLPLTESTPFFFASEFGDISENGVTFDTIGTQSDNLEIGSTSSTNMSGTVFNDEGRLNNVSIKSARAYIGVENSLDDDFMTGANEFYAYAALDVSEDEDTDVGRGLYINDEHDLVAFYGAFSDGNSYTFEEGGIAYGFVWYHAPNNDSDEIYVYCNDDGFFWKRYLWSHTPGSFPSEWSLPADDPNASAVFYMGFKFNDYGELHELVPAGGLTEYYITRFKNGIRERFAMLPMGEYYFNKVNTFSNEINLDGSDVLSQKFDDTVPSLLIQDRNTPTTDKDIISEIQILKRIDIVSLNAISMRTVDLKNLPSTCTYRELLAWAIGVSGSVAFASRPLPYEAVKVQYEPLSNQNWSLSVIPSDYIEQGSLVIDSNAFPQIGTLRAIVGDTEVSETVDTGETFTYENPLLTRTSNITDLATRLNTKATPYNVVSMDLLECPIWYSIYDYIGVYSPYHVDSLGQPILIPFPIMEMSWTWAGRCRGRIASVGDFDSNRRENDSSAAAAWSEAAIPAAGVFDTPTMLGDFVRDEGGVATLGNYKIVNLRFHSTSSLSLATEYSVATLPAAKMITPLGIIVNGVYSQANCYVDTNGTLKLTFAICATTQNTSMVVSGIYYKA